VSLNKINGRRTIILPTRITGNDEVPSSSLKIQNLRPFQKLPLKGKQTLRKAQVRHFSNFHTTSSLSYPLSWTQ
jgi:hypothetical protein